LYDSDDSNFLFGFNSELGVFQRYRLALHRLCQSIYSKFMGTQRKELYGEGCCHDAVNREVNVMERPGCYHGQSKPAADILIVDDVPQNLDLLTHILTRAGYGVRAAGDGSVALEAARDKTPDLILLDIRMPVMDGFEVCRQIKARDETRDVPVIFISGLHDSADKVQGFNVGGVDYITKPIDQAEVLARVRIHLDLYGMHKNLESTVMQRTAQLQETNRALRLISSANKILVRAVDEPSLLNAVCEIMVEVGGFPFCWVGYPQNDDKRPLTVAGYSITGDRPFHSLRQALETDDGAGTWACALDAVRNGTPVMVRNLFEEQWADHPSFMGVRQARMTSGMSLPLIYNRRTYAVLTVLADDADVFAKDEIGLLEELCDDIAYGIHTLREREKHQQAQRALAESEQRYRQLFEKAGEAVFVIQPQSSDSARIIQANQAAAEMHGYSVDELIGMSIKELNTPETAEGFARRNQRVLAGEWIHEEISHLKRDGSPFQTEVSAGPIDIGDQRYVLAFYRDISDRKRMEAEKAAMEVQIRQANKMEAIGTLASGIAHDFNNILSAASGYTELSIPLVPAESILSKNLRKIQQANQRAAELVRHILTLSREKESAAQVLQPKLIIKEAVKLLRASLPSTIEILQEIESDAYILGDAAQVHQIIMNLCVNAGHAMEASGGSLSISLKDQELDADFTRQYVQLSPGRYVVLQVTDTGQGIPDEIIDKVFDPYFTTKSLEKGNGLGLAVVNGIVNTYRGEITVESEVGKGTRFTLFIPAVAAEQGAEAAASVSIPKGTERILFVDDEPALVEIGQQLLQLLGYRVTAKSSSPEALELYLQNPDAFDLLVTDYTMPVMTGMQLAEAVLNNNPALPIVIMSGLETTNIEAEAKLLGVRGIINKPIVIKEIAALIRELLDKSGEAAVSN
jgi:PAS domain S-box-containing protein